MEGFRSLGGDQFLYVVTADPSGRPLGPGFTMEHLSGLAADARPPAAYYTVRRWRPEAAELDMWFVLHDDRAGVSGWASRAAPGDRVALWGPRRSYDPPAGTRAQLLVADETGLGAVAAVLEGLDGSHPAHVVVEVADSDHVVDLPAKGHVTVEWRFRNGDAPGSGSRLVDGVRTLELEADGLYVFGAAELHQVRALRTHLRHDCGLPASHVRLTGYWRRETVAR